MNDDTASCFFVMITIIVAAIISAVLSAWVITILWGWFITPLFGLAVPGVGAAMGLVFTLRVILGTRNEDKETEKSKSFSEAAIKALATAIALPLMYLTMGWVVHLFVQ